MFAGSNFFNDVARCVGFRQASAGGKSFMHSFHVRGCQPTLSFDHATTLRPRIQRLGGGGLRGQGQGKRQQEWGTGHAASCRCRDPTGS